MSGALTIKRATRSGVIPLIGIYSESGCGKTYSALLIARGLVGPSGPIHVIDTESRRASLYADVIPGGFEVLDLDQPFSPSRYIEAIDAVIDAGAKVICIDSISHEWNGIGGVLDWAGENEIKSGKKGLHNWKTPKLEHAKLMGHLLRSPVPVICCIRAKYLTKQGKDAKGNTVIIKDDYVSPIQSEEFIFEMTAHLEIRHDHSINLTKCSHPDLRKCFPTNGPLTIEHGAAIARWCAQGPSGPSDPVKALKRELVELLKGSCGSDVAKMTDWLRGVGVMSATEELAQLTPERLAEIIAGAKRQKENA